MSKDTIHLFNNLSVKGIVANGAASGITTLAAGNTTITGFANVSSTLQVNGVATFAANANFDSGAFFVDGTNNRVGIGTTAPAVNFEVSSATGSATPTPTEIRISTTTTASDYSLVSPWGRLSFYSADGSDAGPKIQGSIDAISDSAAGGRMSMVFKTSAVTTGTLTERMRINAAGSIIAANDMRAPIFYDSANTSFYVDPASTSVLNALNLSTSVNSASYTIGSVLIANTTQLTYTSNVNFDSGALFIDSGSNKVTIGSTSNQESIFTVQASTTLGSLGAVSNVSAIDTVTDILSTASNHGWSNGQFVVLRTDGTSPGGTSVSLSYFINARTANSVTLHTSIAAALAGTSNVNITSAGTGNNFILPAQSYASFDGTNGNSNKIRVYSYRSNTTSATLDWATASSRLGLITDSTQQGFIEFNPPGNNSGVAIGTGGSYFAQYGTSGTTIFTNTTVMGFVNATSSVNSATLSVGTSFIANTTRLVVGTAVGLNANGGIGTAGQVLHSNGTTIYWDTDGDTTYDLLAVANTAVNAGILRLKDSSNANDDVTFTGSGTSNISSNATHIIISSADQYLGTVTSIATANGLSGGPITSTGTLGVTTGSTLTVNTAGIHVNSVLSITDLTLSGNLTVSGTRTYINTTTLEVGDNIVTLNADLGANPPTENAGIEIMRGTSANVQFIWDETNDRWSTNSQPLAISSLVAAGAASGITTLDAGNTTITGFANVSTTLQVGTNTATFGTAAYIVANGNVGIGISAPEYKLDLTSPDNVTTTIALSVQNAARNYGIGIGAYTMSNRNIGGAATTIDYTFDIGGNSIFKTADTERLRITSAGDIGIGTAAPGRRLSLKGGGFAFDDANTTPRSLHWGNGTTYPVIIQGDSTNNFLAIQTASTERMRIDSAGNLLVGTTSSSGRLTVETAGADIGFFDSTDTTAGLKVLTVRSLAASGTPTPAFALRQWRSSFAGGYDVGQIRFDGLSTASTYVEFAGIYASAGTNTTSGAPTSLAFRTMNTSFVTAERMRISADGNVGIGTSSPLSALTVIQPGAGYTSQATHRGTIQIAAGPASLQAGGGLEFLTSTFSNGYGWKMSSIDSTGVHLVFGNRSDSATWTERMRIDSDGDVGIGTSSPTTIFHVQQNNTGNIGMRMRQLSTTQFAGAGLLCNGPVSSSTQGGTAFYHYNRNTGGTNGALAMAQFDENGSFQRSLAEYYYQEQAWIFYTNGSERLRIDSSGNVGIGTTSPGYRLDVVSGDTTASIGYAMRLRSNATATAATLQFTNSGVTTQNGVITCRDDGVMVLQSDGASSLLAFRTNGNERARINSSGEFLTGTSTGGRAVCMFASDMWLRLSNASRQWLIGPSIGSNFNIFDETGGYTAFSIDTSANINARNSIFLGSGQNLDNKIEIGAGRTGSNYAYIDLIGDTTYTDYGLRLIRGNTGANATSQLTHRGTGDMYISTEQAAPLYFQTNSTTRAFIQGDGTMVMNNSLLVGRVSASTDINVANDTGSFSVRGNTSTVAVMSFHRTSAYAINMGLGTDNVFRIGGWSASNNALQMDGSGNLTMLNNVTAYSDSRLKKDIIKIDNALDKVMRLNGYTYTRTDTNTRQMGVIAQEIMEIIPEVVLGSEDTNYSVAYGNMVALLIEAVKELTARVAKLEGK